MLDRLRQMEPFELAAQPDFRHSRRILPDFHLSPRNLMRLGSGAGAHHRIRSCGRGCAFSKPPSR
jgi:hypothetical protein